MADAATAAWLCAIPCALLTWVAVVTFGPWLGDRLFPATPTFDFLTIELGRRGDAHEVGGFLVSLGGPILLALAIVALVRRRPAIPRPLVIGTIVATQAAVIVAVVACFAGQRRPAFGFEYFSTRTLVASGAIAVALLVAGRVDRLRQLFGARSHERRRARILAATAAIALTAFWMLPALQTDRSIAGAGDVVRYHLPFYLDETFAVLNGLTPLVSFTPQYGGVWPWIVAPFLLVFGKTLLAFTTAMALASSLALLGIFGVLRRVTRNSLAALLLFLPFLATTLFPVGETPQALISLGTLAGFYPLRFAGPLLLAWLTARHLSAPDRRVWPLFVLAGLVVMNNTDMGVAAAGAALAALLWTHWPANRREALSLAGNAAGGLAIGFAVVASVTLARSGSLPQLDQLTEFARIFGVNGFAAVPMPGVRGLPLLIWGTYAAALATATVLALGRDRDPVLTGMLAWTGVFGLGSAMYYVARDGLVTTFSMWALAIALLAVAAFRSLGVPTLRRKAAMVLVVFFGLGITACSIAQLPSPPWKQVHRLRNATWDEWKVAIQVREPLALPEEPGARRFFLGVADGPRRFVVRRGAPVALLATVGHRIADAWGIRDVTPYTGYDSLITAEQLERTLDVLRDAGGNTVVVERTDDVEFDRILIRRGFRVATGQGLRTPRIDEDQDYSAVTELGPATADGFVKWVDMHHLHPRALERAPNAAQP